MNSPNLQQDIFILQDSIRENKIIIQKQLSKLKRDLYIAFSIIFLFLISGLAYQLYIFFK
jgi:hypothetical protein